MNDQLSAVIGTAVLAEIKHHGTPGCGGGWHFPCITQKWKWLFGPMEYLVRCWDCELYIGPCKSYDDAFTIVRLLNRAAVFTPRD